MDLTSFIMLNYCVISGRRWCVDAC